jgi:hypothetical protein
VLSESCDDAGRSPHHQKVVQADHALWLQARPGSAATVKVFVLDLANNQAAESVAGLALGIYRSPEAPRDPAVAELPVRTQPAAPGDYVKDGIRFPAKAAGDTLLGAAVGDIGQQALTLHFKAAQLSGLRQFCTINEVLVPHEFTLTVRVNGKFAPPAVCTGRFLPDQGSAVPITSALSPGQSVEVTLQVVDSRGEPAIAVPDLRIGVGAYQMDPYRNVKASAGTTIVDEVVDYGGYTYKLADVRTGSAASNREVTIDTPADKPYVISYGGVSLDKPGVELKIAGLRRPITFQWDGHLPEGGPGLVSPTYGRAAGPAGKVVLKVVRGQPTRGLLYLAIYLPE